MKQIGMRVLHCLEDTENDTNVAKHATLCTIAKSKLWQWCQDLARAFLRRTPQVRALRQQCSRIGRRGEEAANRYLENIGYESLCRNYHAPHGVGELDLIVRDSAGTLCFVEVKTRREKPGWELHPAWAVNQAKQRHLRRAAQAYLRALGQPTLAFRFDVIEVWASRQGEPLELRHWPDAFGLPQRQNNQLF